MRQIMPPIFQRPTVAPFIAEAVVFDGTNDELTLAAQLTNTGARQGGTFSIWLNYTQTGTIIFVRGNRNSNGTGGERGFMLEAPTTGTLRIIVNDGTATGPVVLFQTAILTILGGFNDGDWHHIAASWDLGATPVASVWVDNVENNQAPVTGPTTGDVEWDLPNNWQVSRISGPSDYNGDMAECYLADTYTDLTVTANRQRFITQGRPARLGPTGISGTGSQPLMYFTDEAAVWNAGTNAGKGGAFTMTGAVTDSTNEPVELP